MDQKNLALIVDSDQEFLSSIENDAIFKVHPSILINDGRRAQLILADTTQSIKGLFVNLRLKNSEGFSVVRFAHRARPAMPIFLIYDPGSKLFDSNEIRSGGIHDVLVKPFAYQKILSLMGPKPFIAGTVQASAFEDNEKTTESVQEEDQAFVPISAKGFLAGATSLFDVFVRLSSGRYLKILRSGDSFSPDRIASYQKKLEYFYISRATQEKYLAFCERLAAASIQHAKIPDVTKLVQTLNYGKEIVNFLETNEIHQSHIDYAVDFGVKLQRVLTRLSPKMNNSFLNRFLDEVGSAEHGAACAMIAGVLAQALGIVSTNPVKTIGLASFFHDIGLMELPEALRGEEIEKMSETDAMIYKEHPAIGAAILRTFKGINPVVIQAVEQHHERKNRTGFPNKIGGTSINRIAEVIAISDEFARMIAKSKKEPGIDPIRHMCLYVKSNFSSEISQVFEFVFVSKKSI